MATSILAITRRIVRLPRVLASRREKFARHLAIRGTTAFRSLSSSDRRGISIGFFILDLSPSDRQASAFSPNIARRFGFSLLDSGYSRSSRLFKAALALVILGSLEFDAAWLWYSLGLSPELLERSNFPEFPAEESTRTDLDSDSITRSPT